MDYGKFSNSARALLVAPAGYGKTHTIVEALKYTEGNQLILTHTHAGVASLREKLGAENICTSKYSIETISSFAQKYVTSYCLNSEIPDVDLDDGYHSFIIDKALEIFNSSIIKVVLASTYRGLFVDEYQDCTKAQHELVLSISEYLPTRLLGDPLQGIFNFNEDLVNFDSDLHGFERFPDLATPYRWYQIGSNKELGDLMVNIRKNIEEHQEIDFSDIKVKGLYVFKIKEKDFEKNGSDYRKNVQRIIQNNKNNTSLESLLILVPEYTEVNGISTVRKGAIQDRRKILEKVDFRKGVRLLEAIDDKEFYRVSRKADDLLAKIANARFPYKKLKNFVSLLFTKTSPGRQKNSGINDWIGTGKSKCDAYVKQKQGGLRVVSIQLQKLMQDFIEQPTHAKLLIVLKFLQEDLKLNITRRVTVFNSILKAIEISDIDGVSILDAMKAHKNTVRRVGRKVHGKNIGTTLLTKGLEFDTVVLLDAHRFTCPKHLYVALTRCCKNLIIFTESEILKPQY